MNLEQRFIDTVRRVEEASARAGRNLNAVQLIAVGKTFPVDLIKEAFTVGARAFGENRVQEGAEKAQILPQAEWHLIGPLQSNKARKALEHFSVIHTLDREDLALRLERLMHEHLPGQHKRVLVEVNIGEESQKAGVLPADAGKLVARAAECTSLVVDGLMAIPPFNPDPEGTRGYFRQLRELRDQIQDDTGHALPHLSMGMSHDFEVAIAEGATMVRVGTAIFGTRGPRG